jgi:hypothetical protein
VQFFKIQEIYVGPIQPILPNYPADFISRTMTRSKRNCCAVYDAENGEFYEKFAVDNSVFYLNYVFVNTAIAQAGTDIFYNSPAVHTKRRYLIEQCA